MTTRRPNDRLAALASRAGFEVEWRDAHHNTQHVPESTLATLLERMGLPCGNATQIRHSATDLEAELSGRKLPPLMTAVIGRGIALPAAAVKSGSHYRIELESGAIIDGRFTAPKGEQALLAPIDEAGYHSLVINDHRMTLAVAPPRCYTVADAWRTLHDGEGDREAAPPVPPLWGIAAQLYGLRRTGDGGIGDYTALAQLARHSAQRGAHALAVSPTHAMFSAQPERFSPYAPSSRLWLNVTHIDPAAVFGADASACASALAGNARSQYEDLALIDWPNATRLKLAVLRKLYEQFNANERPQHSPRALEFHGFCERAGRALEDHARFESLQAAQLAQGGDGHWRNWPDALRDPRSPEVEAFAAAHRNEVDFHLFLQWLASRGLLHAQHTAREAGMAIGLIADLAVGCDSAGSHAWSYPDDMLQGVSVGAPPDLFNQAGQSWGLTTFSPRAMRTQGFVAFIDMLRAAFAHAGGIRIDHVLGLRRLWLVPEGESARNGAYLRYPLEDLLRLIALESWRHRAIVIGEDLGTVPAGFRERLDEHGIEGIRVLWFEGSPDGHGFKAPADWDRYAVGTTTTHDLPTVAGWWLGSDIRWRNRIGQTMARADGRDPEQAALEERARERADLWRAFQQAGVAAAGVAAPADDDAPVDEALAFVAATPGSLVMFPLEDLLALAEQPNLPGSIDEHPNWRRRMTLPVDAMFDDPTFTDRLLAVDRARRAAANVAAAPPSNASSEPDTP
ncbi:4-alpha-glucanotransferase [Paraburkholderia sp. MMS20-SJTN17]|uniref:4-alpha-glucanotransferase n=1 Tax=Paraburkholderia translucens TaxID=2886945 RepID=A0ABS8KLR3_9BURK|nr:4-alpha-glucanotransferase [Paraburkholderia sp. MMS20-SJTN17]MCC8405670.1 4-alpha-glucanotransferase [Paraburkholderia sp. MMS20-SJTN17]